MTKAEENAKKLERLSTHLADNPNPDAKIQNRLINAIEDAVDTEATDKELTMYYTYARKQAKRFGYGNYLSQGSIPTVPDELVDAYQFIDTAVAMIVPADPTHPSTIYYDERKTRKALLLTLPKLYERLGVANPSDGTLKPTTKALGTVLLKACKPTEPALIHRRTPD